MCQERSESNRALERATERRNPAVYSSIRTVFWTVQRYQTLNKCWWIRKQSVEPLANLTLARGANESLLVAHGDSYARTASPMGAALPAVSVRTSAEETRPRLSLHSEPWPNPWRIVGKSTADSLAWEQAMPVGLQSTRQSQCIMKGYSLIETREIRVLPKQES